MRTVKLLTFILLSPLTVLAATLNVSLNTSAVAGSNVKVVFDITANTLNLNTLDILNFSAPGSTMGLPETSGGLVDGDLILIHNPAPFTFIQTGSFFNELIVNLGPIGNSVTFNLSYTTSSPAPGTPPDEIAFFLLDSTFQPLFPTADPLGTDALFVVDLNGPSTSPAIYSPATESSPGNIQITIPGQTTTVPEPSTFSIAIIAVAALGLKARSLRRRAQR
jgi:hypothetical protein